MKPLAGLVRHDGNECLFKAIEMSIASTVGGVPLHVHVEGLRGTGKTTILRSARAVFPRISRIRGCLYNCDPENPHCPEHSHLTRAQIEGIGAEEIPMPFLEISHSAKTGTVVGSIDLKKITNRASPEAAILPGTIPQAHRGVIFVDEINRLAETSPELADILLSVMGTKPGSVQIEETGLPVVELSVQVSVWAASNPDEEPGPLEDIRRQLADRFDLVANVSRPSSAQVVKSIFSGSLSNEGPVRNAAELAGAAGLIGSVEVPAYLQEMIAGIYVDFALESLRAVDALQHGSRVAAALDRRLEAGLNDLIGVVPLALHHRVSVSTMAQILKYLTERSAAREPSKYRTTPPGGDGAARAGNSDQNVSQGPPQDGQGPMDRLFARLRETLMGHSPGPSAGRQNTGGAPGRSGQGGGCGGRSWRQQDAGSYQNGGSDGGSDGGGAGGWANPMDVPVFAPGARATPLVQLPVSEMVKTGDDLR